MYMVSPSTHDKTIQWTHSSESAVFLRGAFQSPISVVTDRLLCIHAYIAACQSPQIGAGGIVPLINTANSLLRSGCINSALLKQHNIFWGTFWFLGIQTCSCNILPLHSAAFSGRCALMEILWYTFTEIICGEKVKWCYE